MCGICGIVGATERRELDVMTDSMRHRGPDGRGTRVFEGAGLGHRRLAILDPTPAGAQPMSFAERWWITYNGEIYNFPSLRAELEARGERFATDCDTEVLLRLFALDGPAMLTRLNGIFAFAIWDDRDKELFLARDRIGVKPLYYVRSGGRFGFASELRALLPMLGRARLDPRGLAEYLTFLWVPDDRTALDGVMKVPAGHCGRVRGGRLELRPYWDMQLDPEGAPEDVWRERLAETVARATRRQMLSDVPVGSFLSGGVDSSAIVAGMAPHAERVPTWTVGYSPEDRRHEIMPDDVVHARRVARQFDTDHHEILLRPDVLDLLPRVVWHLEEPVADPAAVSTYLICREAGRDMPVMLSGVGGDELFAGYPRHLAFRISQGLDRIPATARRALEALAEPLARPGAPGRLRGPRRNLWKYMRAAGLPPQERYLSFLTYFTSPELHSLLCGDISLALDGHDPRARHREHLQSAAAPDALASFLYLDVKTFVPSLNLTYTDKMSMANSVEVRVPLLDDEIVALSARIPTALKLRGWRRKYVLKRSQEGILDRDVIWRRKAGFGAPLRSWVVGDLRPMMDDLLSPEAIRKRGLVRPEAVTRLRREVEDGAADWSFQLYALLNLELWCRQWTDAPWTLERLERESAAVPHAR